MDLVGAITGTVHITFRLLSPSAPNLRERKFEHAVLPRADVRLVAKMSRRRPPQ